MFHPLVFILRIVEILVCHGLIHVIKTKNKKYYKNILTGFEPAISRRVVDRQMTNTSIDSATRTAN